jgi:hypothetical protein
MTKKKSAPRKKQVVKCVDACGPACGPETEKQCGKTEYVLSILVERFQVKYSANKKDFFNCVIQRYEGRTKIQCLEFLMNHDFYFAEIASEDSKILR